MATIKIECPDCGIVHHGEISKGDFAAFWCDCGYMGTVDNGGNVVNWVELYAPAHGQILDF